MVPLRRTSRAHVAVRTGIIFGELRRRRRKRKRLKVRVEGYGFEEVEVVWKRRLHGVVLFYDGKTQLIDIPVTADE